jgi:RNA polymerase sigma factor (sigma-70 family)
MEYLEFRQLASELKSGDSNTFKAIFEQHASYCISKLVRQFRCAREDAEDIYVEAVLNLREKIITEKIEAVTDLRAYLFGTCKNMMLVELKKKQRINTAVTEINHLAQTEVREDYDDAKYKEELLAVTEQAMGNLPAACQQLLKLFYFDKLSLEEIATHMQLANANVAKVSKARCFHKLITLIKDLQQQKKKYAIIK